MTPAQRATLETMATTTEATPGASRELLDAAAAIRAALAEVDRLTGQRDDYANRLSTLPAPDEATALATVASALAAVARPDTDHDYRREQAKRGMDALQSAKQHAARRNAEVADLRSRAIPKDADFTLYVTLSHDRFMVTNERVDAPRLTLRTYLIGSAVDKGPFPTLAAALAAAAGDDHG